MITDMILSRQKLIITCRQSNIIGMHTRYLQSIHGVLIKSWSDVSGLKYLIIWLCTKTLQCHLGEELEKYYVKKYNKKSRQLGCNVIAFIHTQSNSIAMPIDIEFLYAFATILIGTFGNWALTGLCFYSPNYVFEAGTKTSLTQHLAGLLQYNASEALSFFIDA